MIRLSLSAILRRKCSIKVQAYKIMGELRVLHASYFYFICKSPKESVVCKQTYFIFNEAPLPPENVIFYGLFIIVITYV